MNSLVITALFSTILMAAPAAAAEFYTIERNDLRCVAANADFYKKSSSSDIVEIDLPSCKSPEKYHGPMRRNIIFPDAVAHTPANNTDADTKIKLSKAQLTCLSDHNFVIALIPRFSIVGHEDRLKIPTDFSCP